MRAFHPPKMQAVLETLVAAWDDQDQFLRECDALKRYPRERNTNDLRMTVRGVVTTPIIFVIDAFGLKIVQKAHVVRILWECCGVPTESKYTPSALCMAVRYNLVPVAEVLLNVCSARFNPHDDFPGVLSLCDLVDAPSMLPMLRLLADDAHRIRSSLSMIDRSPYADGRTALHVATLMRNVEAVSILLCKFHFSPGIRDAAGRLAIDYQTN